MSDPVIHGPAYSTYVRSVRLAFLEKGAPYALNEVDIFAGENQTPAHLARHPYGKVPAFEHDGFALYETDAILRYVDLAFDGPSLQPADARGQARMTQIMKVVDAYGYPPLIGTLVVQRLVMPKLGETPNEQAITEAIPEARKALGELEKLIAGPDVAVGDRLSLADLHLVPVLDYLATTAPEGPELLEGAPRIKALYESLARRDSVRQTRPSL